MTETQAILERLDRLYVCRKCGLSLLFIADVDDHIQAWGHKEFNEVMLDLSDGEALT